MPQGLDATSLRLERIRNVRGLWTLRAEESPDPGWGIFPNGSQRREKQGLENTHTPSRFEGKTHFFVCFFVL